MNSSHFWSAGCLLGLVTSRGGESLQSLGGAREPHRALATPAQHLLPTPAPPVPLCSGNRAPSHPELLRNPAQEPESQLSGTCLWPLQEELRDAGVRGASLLSLPLPNPRPTLCWALKTQAFPQQFKIGGRTAARRRRRRAFGREQRLGALQLPGEGRALSLGSWKSSGASG